MKLAALLTFSVALLLGTIPILADPPVGTAVAAIDDNPWPGYVAGGRYLRNLEWGVAFWGPGGANQQLQQGDPAALVRYSLPTTRGKPGYVITVLGYKLKEDLSGEQILAQAAAGIRKIFGDKVTDLKTTTAHQDKPSAPPSLIVGRIVCQTPAPAGITGKETGQPILRHYVYLRLRAKQHLAIVAESTPAAGDDVAAIVDSLAAGVTAFDPQAESVQTADGAERTAKLLAAMQPADWEGLVRGAKPQWFKLWAGPNGSEGSDPKPDAPANQPLGWLYSSIARKAAGQIESITSAHVSQGDTAISSYTAATVDLATGEETIRQWARSARKDEAVAETFLLAHRNGSEEARGTVAGADKFEITTSPGPGQGQPGRSEKKSTRRIPSQPYLPAALHDLLLARLVKEQGKTFGAFRFLDGEVIFETIQPAGPTEISRGGSKTPAVRVLLRNGINQPLILRYTDPSGQSTLREMTSPQTWMDAVEESDVPADLRASLTRPPQWP